MIKNEKLVWRIIAVICTLVWTIVLFAVNAFTPEHVYGGGVFTLLHNNILYGFSIAISITLIFFPMQFYLYAVKCWVWALLGFVLTSGPNAILMYALGCAFAYRMFSSKQGQKKYLMIFVPLLIVIAFQYRLDVDVMVDSILNLLFLTVFFGLLYLLLIHPLVEKSKAPPSDAIVVADCNLSVEEFALLKALLRADKYKAMSIDAKISESSVKQRIKSLLEKIGADNRGNLLSLHKNGKLILPLD